MSARLNALMTAFSPELGARNPSEFARALGIGETTWANYVRDGNRPQIDHAYKLKERFNVDLDWIYQGETEHLTVNLARKLEAALSEGPAFTPVRRSKRA